ncbi:MAG: hypothetical protein K8I60_00440 [Anaerolineae bacterium]|nr:hypothetical protein [Anaerolineae bacterium]
MLNVIVTGPSQLLRKIFINNLMTIIENLGKLRSNIWHEFSDVETFESLKQIRDELETSEGKSRTRGQKLLTTFSVRIHNFPSNDDFNLRLTELDLNAVSSSDEAKYLEAFRTADIVWFVLDFDNQADNTAKSEVFDYINKYLKMMKQQKLSPVEIPIILIYIEKHLMQSKLPQSITDYLREDPYQNLQDRKLQKVEFAPLRIDAYFRYLQYISYNLAQFALGIFQDGATAIETTEDNGISVGFCINSINTNAFGKIHSNRSVDPLIWSMAIKDNSIRTRHYVLILGYGIAKHGPSLDKSVKSIFRILSLSGDVAIYCLGDIQPLQLQDLPSDRISLGVTKAPVIGPILDRLTDDALVVVIADEEVIDLQDYVYFPNWEHRIFFLRIGESDLGWPQSININPSEPISSNVINKILMHEPN